MTINESIKKLAKDLIALTPYRIVHKDNKQFNKIKLKKKEYTTSSYLKLIPNDKCYLSLIIPAYNVESYIDELLKSIFDQSSSFTNFEVIIVDDGSTDKTPEKIKAWADLHPDKIKHVRQVNAGAAAARATGLELATGTWIAFPDSDDFLHIDYFAHMLKETTSVPDGKLIAVVSNMILYFEENDTFADTHPLRYRFQNKVVRKSSHDMGDYMQLSGATIWLHHKTVKESGIKPDARIFPAFEDAHFLNKLFIHAPQKTISFVPSAIYYYRKRRDNTSLLNSTSTHLNWYSVQIEHGSIDLLRDAKLIFGMVPRHIQRTCLYDIFWRFKHHIHNPERDGKLTKEQTEEFKNLLFRVFEYIDAETIEEFHHAGFNEEHKVALLAMFKGQRRTNPVMYLKQLDTSCNRAQFSYFSGGDDQVSVKVFVNGEEVPTYFPSHKDTFFFGHRYYVQHFYWIQLGVDDKVRFEIDGTQCRIKNGPRPINNEANWLELARALKKAEPKTVDDQTLRLRDYILATREKYGSGLVFIDRISKADDNAEHLYRHLMKTDRSHKAWFVLSSSSPDWDRLKAEGFKLLPYGSDDHISAQMNADLLISSHADHPILWPVKRQDFEDLAHFRYVFLQHGVTTNDLSGWLNGKDIRLFITATPEEFASIASSESRYVYSEREVILSGFPRHDTLLEKSTECQPDSILIMPTWRRYLTGEQLSSGAPRERYEGFKDSQYALNWRALLTSPELEETASLNGLRVVLALHPEMAIYLDDFDIPSYIETVDVRENGSYQDLFARAKISLTDYSSAATEVAYLQRPVVYFQFDQDEMFSGGHVYQGGYFCFERDGFGPVAKSVEGALVEIKNSLSGKEPKKYSVRRAETFPFRDGNCSERVCQQLEIVLGRRI